MRNERRVPRTVIRPEALPSGRWRGIARKRDGKKVTLTFDLFRDARDWAIAKQAEIDGGDDGGGGDSQEITPQRRALPSFALHVTEWAKRGIPDCELSTLRGYQVQARMLAARWPTARVDKITEDMILDYLSELRDEGFAPSTRTLRLTVLRHAMRDAIRKGYRTDDPTLTIKGPKRREHQARVLTDPELMRLIASLPGWLRAAALLGHDAGLRISEACGLRMCNLDLMRGFVNVNDIIDVDGSLREYPKSKTSRPVKLSQRCLDALRQHYAAYPPAGALGHVFTSPEGRLRPGRIYAEWDRALEMASLEGDKPTWHDLRHSCATTMADAGKDPWVIQQILGHGNIATTQRYVRAADLSRQDDAVSVFGPSGSQASLG